MRSIGNFSDVLAGQSSHVFKCIEMVQSDVNIKLAPEYNSNPSRVTSSYTLPIQYPEKLNFNFIKLHTGYRIIATFHTNAKATGGGIFYVESTIGLFGNKEKEKTPDTGSTRPTNFKSLAIIIHEYTTDRYSHGSLTG